MIRYFAGPALGLFMLATSSQASAQVGHASAHVTLDTDTPVVVNRFGVETGCRHDTWSDSERMQTYVLPPVVGHRVNGRVSYRCADVDIIVEHTLTTTGVGTQGTAGTLIAPVAYDYEIKVWVEIGDLPAVRVFEHTQGMFLTYTPGRISRGGLSFGEDDGVLRQPGVAFLYVGDRLSWKLGE